MSQVYCYPITVQASHILLCYNLSLFTAISQFATSTSLNHPCSLRAPLVRRGFHETKASSQETLLCETYSRVDASSNIIFLTSLNLESILMYLPYNLHCLLPPLMECAGGLNGYQLEIRSRKHKFEFWLGSLHLIYTQIHLR